MLTKKRSQTEDPILSLALMHYHPVQRFELLLEERPSVPVKEYGYWELSEGGTTAVYLDTFRIHSKNSSESVQEYF